MQKTLETPRLSLRLLRKTDAAFILELVNTPGWIEFIGDKNVHAIEHAWVYIENIIAKPEITYWVIYLKKELIPVGIITYIKRPYLAHHDIGFALLPTYHRHGYAFEATQKVLDHVVATNNHTHINAIVMPANRASVQLLTKLGLTFEKEISIKDETVNVYVKSYI